MDMSAKEWEMAQFSNDTSFVIVRNEAVQCFCRVNPDGSHTPLEFKSETKAGDVAKQIAKANPNKQIGILTTMFSPKIRAIYGDIMWMKKGFEQ